MTTTLKKTRKGKTGLNDVLYCFCLVIVIGLGAVSPARAMRESPTTGSEWKEQAVGINSAYKDMQEKILGIDSSSTIAAKLIKRFDRKASRWMECLTESMRQPNGILSPDSALDAALVRSQINLIDGLVRYAKTCSGGLDLPCAGFARIQVVFSATESPDEPGFTLTSAFRGNPFGNTWDNFLSVSTDGIE